MRFATLFGAMIGAAAIGAGGTYALAHQQATQDRETYAGEAVMSSRTAYASCGPVTVIVVGANSMWAGMAWDVASKACAGQAMGEQGEGQPLHYLVRER